MKFVVRIAITHLFLSWFSAVCVSRYVEVIKTEICPSLDQWEEIRTANTTSGRTVTVVFEMAGPQLFYVRRCRQDVENRPCRLVSDEYSTRCKTTETAVSAFVQYDDERMDFDFIVLPGGCACTETRIRQSPPADLPLDLSELFD